MFCFPANGNTKHLEGHGFPMRSVKYAVAITLFHMDKYLSLKRFDLVYFDNSSIYGIILRLIFLFSANLQMPSYHKPRKYMKGFVAKGSIYC